MRKILSFLMMTLFSVSMFAADPVEIAKATFNGKNATYTEGWTTTGTGVSRTDCIIIGKGENITSPSIDLSAYDSISITFTGRRYGSLAGSKATVSAAYGSTELGTIDITSSSVGNVSGNIGYKISGTLSASSFVFTCTNATSAGSSHGAGIGSITITGVEKSVTPEPTTKTLYCKVAQSWWTADGAAVGIYAWKGEGGEKVENAAWPGVRMALAENETDVWTATIDAKYEKVIFVRVNASGNISDWGAKTADLVLADAGENDLYTITSTTAVWGDPGVTGAWSKYEYVAPQPAAKFYITGTAALVGEELQWNPAAIKSMEDSYELSLKAGKEYRMKITVDGTWDTAKGIEQLTERAAGLIDMNGNIGFSLKEDGKVKVTYTGTVFKLEGNFVESPIAKTYFATTSGWTEDAESNVVVNADNSLTVNIVKGKEAAWQAQIHYQAPVAKAGKVYDLSIKFKATNAINGVIVKYQDNKEMLIDNTIALEKDVELAYSKTGLVGQDGGNGILVFDFGYAPANTVVTISAITITEKDAPAPVVLEDGFYLIGKIGGVDGWDEAGLKAEHKFGPNLENPVEFMLNVTLAEGDEIQVVNVLTNAITAWFPGGEGNNFVITAAYAGAKTIYFRPDKQGGEGWHHGCIYIEKNKETAISNTVVEGKAQKVMMGGQLFILRDGKTYNIQGKEVK